MPINSAPHTTTTPGEIIGLDASIERNLLVKSIDYGRFGIENSNYMEIHCKPGCSGQVVQWMEKVTQSLSAADWDVLFVRCDIILAVFRN